MSHEIAGMAYVGEKPWHGLGAELTAGASLATWLVEAGLNWEVLESPELFYYNGVLTVAPKAKVLHRSDTGFRLGTVSNVFKVVQPGEVLSFLFELCESNGLVLETAGALLGGRRFWGLANTGRAKDAGSGDTIQQYVLLVSGADGTLSTIAKTTATRVVCFNTLSIALRGKAQFKVSHKSKFKEADAKLALGFSVEEGNVGFDAMIATLRALNPVKVSEEEARAFFYSLICPPTREEARNLKAQCFADLLAAPMFELANPTTKYVGSFKLQEEDRLPRVFDSLLESYHTAPGAMPGTARGLVEGVSYYVDHLQGRGADTRVTSAWLGQGDTLKSTAYEHAAIFAGLLDRPAFVNKDSYL